jgi:hypothetical protein
MPVLGTFLIIKGLIRLAMEMRLSRVEQVAEK